MMSSVDWMTKLLSSVLSLLTFGLLAVLFIASFIIASPSRSLIAQSPISSLEFSSSALCFPLLTAHFRPFPPPQRTGIHTVSIASMLTM